MAWNAGGWFGAQVGATTWMLIAGTLATELDPAAGTTVIMLFVVPNVLGWILWQTRRFSCYASTQTLVAAAGVCSLIAVHVLEDAEVWAQIQSGGQVSAYSTYWIIGLVCGGLMLMFHLRFGGRESGPD